MSNSGSWLRLEAEVAAESEAGSRFEVDKWVELPHLLISGTLANPLDAKFSLNQNKVVRGRRYALILVVGVVSAFSCIDTA